MANNRNLINAFDDCIERLTTGENLDDILKDYPDSADYLRDLLMIGERISEVHNADDETNLAQSRGRDKLQQTLKEKPKRGPRSRMRPYGLQVVAAIVAVIFGVGLLILALMPSYSAPIAYTNLTTDSPIRATQIAMNDSFALTSTQLLGELTASAEPFMLEMTGTVGNSFEMTATQVIKDLTAIASAEAQATMLVQNIPDDFSITATHLVSQAIASVDPFNLEATQVSRIVPTSTPFVENFDTTATALLMPTITLVGSPIPPTLAPINPQDIIITSVASMEQATVTPSIYDTGDVIPDIPSSGGESGVDNAFKTTSVPQPMSTNQTTATSTSSPALTQTASPPGTQVADGTYAIPPQNNNVPAPLPALIPLNAGEIDDNDEWDTYLLYRREFMARNMPFYDVDVTGRQIITVLDETGEPVLGATVRIFANDAMIAETLTYATGQTMFLPNADERSRGVIEFFVIIEKNGISQQFILNLTDRTSWTVTLPTTINREAVKLDVLFLIDTTSSMGDEIAQLQNNILHISDAVDGFADNVDVHYGLVLYREHDNFEYLTRRHDFIGDVTEFQTYLNAVTANSGDNNPDWDEALNVGLDESLYLMSWRDEDTIKLIFLVADASPHINHPLEPITYDQSIQSALARGIKIHPIASSGLEPQGEFIFRQIAQVTMGHFLFLTYDNGIAGTVGEVRPELDIGLPDSLDPIGGYTVDRLADVVLRLIQDEILTFRGIIQP